MPTHAHMHTHAYALSLSIRIRCGVWRAQHSHATNVKITAANGDAPNSVH